MYPFMLSSIVNKDTIQIRCNALSSCYYSCSSVTATSSQNAETCTPIFIELYFKHIYAQKRIQTISGILRGIAYIC